MRVSTGLSKLAYYTALDAKPMKIPAKYQNETYHLDFNGPTLRRSPARDDLVRNLTLTYSKLGAGHLQPGSKDVIEFISWVPWDNDTLYDYVRSLNGRVQPPLLLDENSTDVARIYVMSSLGSWNKTIPKLIYSYTYDMMQVNVTECQLFNATYEVDFNFSSPDQTHVISQVILHNPVRPYLWSWQPFDSDGNATVTQNLSYLMMMKAFNSLLVGYTYYPKSSVDSSNWNMTKIDFTQQPATQEGLQELFQNFTLSLLSSIDFT